MRKLQAQEFALPKEEQEKDEYEDELYVSMDEKIRHHLAILKERDPQHEINGMRNVWIVKPNCTFAFIQSCQEEGASVASITFTISPIILSASPLNSSSKSTLKTLS